MLMSSRSSVRISILFLSLILSFHQGFAACSPGERSWVTACDHIDATANWDEKQTNDCTWNPPPGYAIFNHKAIEHSNSNGGKSIALLAGGSNFSTATDYQSARNTTNELLGQYTDEKGDNKYKARYDAVFNQSFKYARDYQTNNNTIHMEVSASGHGNFLDRKRGWIDVSIEAEIICLGDPDPEELSRQMLQSAGLPNDPNLLPVAVHNKCDENILVGVHWKKASGDWQTHAWLGVEPNQLRTLSKDDVTIMTNDDYIYYYAESYSFPRKNKWSGTDSDAIKIKLASEFYSFKKIKAPIRSGKRVISLVCKN